ncbi:MAG: hypothetical protein EZS28_044274, partial [Streblomastix strix]
FIGWEKVDDQQYWIVIEKQLDDGQGNYYERWDQHFIEKRIPFIIEGTATVKIRGTIIHCSGDCVYPIQFDCTDLTGKTIQECGCIDNDPRSDICKPPIGNVYLYVRSDGNDLENCNSTNPCKTLNADFISNNINIPYIYQVYIMDSSSINYKAEITQTFSERIYGPLANESTTVRNLLIETEGQFDVKGKILFNYINFVVYATSLSNGQHTIQGLLSTSQISLQNCQYHMASCGISIGKSLVCMLKGGTQTITNLTVSDITSVENIIKAEFDESGTLDISNSQFERVTKTSNSVIGGTTKVILSYASNQVSISNSQFKVCKALYTQGGAIFVELKNPDAQITLTQTIFDQCESQSGGGIYSQLLDGELNIDSTTFDTCTVTQPGNGGALSLYQQTANSAISITNSQFKDCKTLSGSSSIYGWGGGIFLFTSISSNALSSSNLLMIDLVFNGCYSVIGGHNIHIRSPNTKETGLAISSNNLLTVNGTTNLYISLSYIS